MKITELIDILKDMHARYGDLDTAVDGRISPTPINEVRYCRPPAIDRYLFNSGECLVMIAETKD